MNSQSTSPVMVEPAGWGPNGKRAAISFTFDNLGEAAAIEMGDWPADAAIGSHHSATKVVPQLLKLFPELIATFFVEAWNCEIYPRTIASLVEAGHEIGLHGWRHEVWNRLDDERQRSIIQRSTAAMRSLNIVPQGFRPPGGHGSPLLHTLLREEGMIYVSDVGGVPEVEGNIVRLPFQWRGVDGVFLEPDLGNAVGVSGVEDAGLDGMIRSHERAIESVKREGGHLVFVFHPFLLGKDPARIDALARLVKKTLSDDQLWVAPCNKVADWMLREKAGQVFKNRAKGAVND